MVVLYEDKYEKDWDELVLNKSMNGNFFIIHVSSEVIPVQFTGQIS